MTDVIAAVQTCDVAIIGGGPAGLSAATSLKRHGVGTVVVLERENQAGGIPRHCAHSPFGMREFHRILTGPAYARRLTGVAMAAGVDIRTKSTVVALHTGGRIDVTTPEGAYTLEARRVILATGVRETPRSARLISGARPLGVTTTGALQSMVHLKNQKPFTRPVIIGTELVSFSALMTCRKAGIRPVAMLEEAARITARRPAQWLATGLGVPIHYRTGIRSIEGDRRVERVVVTDGLGTRREIACDGVLFTGQFTPESALARMADLDIDAASGGPVVDQYGRCSDPAYFATGNVLRPVETAGWSWREGRQVADRIADDLAGRLPDAETTIAVTVSGPIKYVVPQRIGLPAASTGAQHFQLRFEAPAKGVMVAEIGGRAIWSKPMTVLPERRYLVPVAAMKLDDSVGQLDFRFRSDGK